MTKTKEKTNLFVLVVLISLLLVLTMATPLLSVPSTALGESDGSTENPYEIGTKAVEELIDAIGTVKYPDSKKAIESARTAYEDLTDSQKELVENYATLTAAEQEYKELAEAAESTGLPSLILCIVVSCVFVAIIVIVVVLLILEKREKEQKETEKE